MRSATALVSALLLVCNPAMFAAPERVALDVDQLLEAARAHGGEVYPVQPDPEQLADPPDRMLAYYAMSAADYLSVRMPVPAEGHYALRSRALWGPWAPGRLGRFGASAGSVPLPGVLQGWYGAQPTPAYLIRDVQWGVAHFSPPAAEVQLFLTHGGQGNLLLLSDLRLEPVAEDRLKPEEIERRVPAPPPPPPAPDPEPAFDVRRIRGLEWTTFVRRADRAIEVDGDLSDWPQNGDTITIDAGIIPDRGWGAPPPESDADLSAEVQFLWDDERLYLAARVRDDQVMSPKEDGAWQTPFAHDSLVAAVKPPPWLTAGSRSVGFAPLEMSFGLSYHAPGLSPRALGPEAEYVTRPAPDGYVIEAAIPFSLLGWKPARAGDRFPLGLILVDIDPDKPAGRTFTQYGWNFGPGSAAGMGELRLTDSLPAAGELIPAGHTVPPGGALEYAGSVDVERPAVLESIDIDALEGGHTVLSVPVRHRFEQAGRYSLTGRIPLADLPESTYNLRLRWE